MQLTLVLALTATTATLIHASPLSDPPTISSQKSGLEDWVGLVPPEIASITSLKMVETSLDYAMFKNHSHVFSARAHATRSTYRRLTQKGMKGKNQITLESMQDWLEQYYEVTNVSTIKIDDKYANGIGVDGPSKDMIMQAARLNMRLMGATSPNDTISSAQFRNFTDKLFATKFQYAFSICQAIAFRNEQCEHIVHHSGNSTLKKLRRKVDGVQEMVEEFCTTGLTALGRYRVETCQLAIPFDAVAMSENVQQESCYRQFQCYLVKDNDDDRDQRSDAQKKQQQVTDQLQSIDVRVKFDTPTIVGVYPLIRTLLDSAFAFYRGVSITFFTVAMLGVIGIAFMPTYFGSGAKFMFLWVKLLILAFLGMHFALDHMLDELKETSVFHRLPYMGHQ